ncbi:MAG: epoxyqueuosine reductase QueH [Candidatus Izemoplasmatales bacterium]|nr:epoxyqueuosine reductase QueH [Candidatus Izemoplasmatales bacterium]
MKLLLHICCAPCSIMCVEQCRKEAIDVVGYWYNPNIHPATEYMARFETLKDYAASISLPLIVESDYGLRHFLKLVADNPDDRCRHCYRNRLETTAKRAKAEGFDAFSSTLFISPYQAQDVLKEIAETVSKEVGILFHYIDFRPYFREGQQRARDCGLYLQKYCGCVYSEEERYQKKLNRMNRE